MKKFLSVLLSLILVMACTVPCFALGTGSAYTITNPYETVDWNTWKNYKTELHTHTTYSDSDLLLSESVERYYELGFDILSVTDHGVLGTDWTQPAKMCTIVGYNAFIANYDTLTEERNAEIAAGTDRDGRGMYNLKNGIELNALVLKKNHVNGFFCDYGYDVWGTENDYETAVAENAKAGGITFLNHIGDWTNACSDVTKNEDPETIQYFSDILLKYPSCTGMEIVNDWDYLTKNDRLLWDEILHCVILGSNGSRNVFAYANDDAHDMDRIGIAFEQFMLPEVNDDTIRTAMETGTFFATSRYANTELGNGSGRREDLFAGFDTPYPTVTNIVVDDDADTITVTFKNAYKCEWLSDGTGENAAIDENHIDGAYGISLCAQEVTNNELSTVTLDLNDYKDDMGCFVRFQLYGEGGMTYSQAFIVDDGTLAEQDGTAYTAPEYPEFINILLNLLKILKNTKIAVLLEKI